MRRTTRKPTTPMERRALETAEVALDASGLRYQSGQIPGLAHILVVFAEHEMKRAARLTEGDALTAQLEARSSDDEPDITIGAEPWTDEQLADMRAIATRADLRHARELVESFGFGVSEQLTSDDLKAIGDRVAVAREIFGSDFGEGTDRYDVDVARDRDCAALLAEVLRLLAHEEAREEAMKVMREFIEGLARLPLCDDERERCAFSSGPYCETHDEPVLDTIEAARELLQRLPAAPTGQD